MRILTKWLKFARAYHKLGIPVVVNTKGTKKASEPGWPDLGDNIEDIEKWGGQKRYQKANLGINCGLAGWAVIDLDVKNGKNGIEAWEKLNIDYDGAYISKTPSGGLHIIFKAPEGVYLKNSAGKLADGIDVRAIGGQILVEPSVLPEGEYEWIVGPTEGSEPLEMPKELVELIQSVGGSNGGNGVQEGGRNVWLASVAGQLRREGMEAEQLLEALLESNTALDSPLEDDEVTEIAESIGKYDVPEIIEFLESNEWGDATLLAKLYKDQLAYDHSKSAWYKWAGNWWVHDSVKAMSELVAVDVGNEYVEASHNALDNNDITQVKKLNNRAQALRSKWRINNVLSLATSQPSIRLAGDEWDTDLMLLGVGNGVLDLREGQLRAGAADDFIRTHTDIDFDPEAECPRFDQFMLEIFSGDSEMVSFMQRLLGYAITGKSTEHKMPVLWGKGRNGKDTLLTTLDHVLQSYASPVSNSVLVRSSSEPGAATPHICALQGLRLAWASETEEGQRLSVSQVKYITGGGAIVARPLYGNPIKFKPSHLVMLITNHKPHADATDYALWSRLLLVPFTEQFVAEPKDDDEHEHKSDPQLVEKLKLEAPGILNWLLAGCLEWQEGGLRIPSKVKAETEQYRSDEDTIGQFIEDECTLDVAGDSAVRALYKRYREWSEANGIRPMSNGAFGRRMTDRNFVKKRVSAGIRYYGIVLNPQTVLVSKKVKFLNEQARGLSD